MFIRSPRTKPTSVRPASVASSAASELGADGATAPALPDGLSPRELQVLVELARGRSNREIGQVLHVSEHTAANHIRSILRKTSCANRTEAAGYAMRRGLVPD